MSRRFLKDLAYIQSLSMLRIDIEIKEMQKISYALTLRSLIYAQVCTHPDFVYTVRILGRYLSNLTLDYWNAAKRVMQYLQITKYYILTY